jgi:hypothetical protein
MLWFLRLDGWPVFLAVVAAGILFSVGLSVLMTWLSNRSIVQNAILAVIGVALIGVGLFGSLVLAARFAFPD